MGRTFGAFEGTELDRLLDDEVEDALGRAIATIDDQFTQEIAARFADADRYIRTFSDEHLPSIFRHWYSPAFVRRLYICFIQVVARLTAIRLARKLAGSRTW
jgi:hypothetical protein